MLGGRHVRIESAKARVEENASACKIAGTWPYAVAACVTVAGALISELCMRQSHQFMQALTAWSLSKG